MEDEKLNNAIEHCRKMILENKDCADEHWKLMNWLLELKDLRDFRLRVINAIYR